MENKKKFYANASRVTYSMHRLLVKMSSTIHSPPALLYPSNCFLARLQKNKTDSGYGRRGIPLAFLPYLSICRRKEMESCSEGAKTSLLKATNCTEGRKTICLVNNS